MGRVGVVVERGRVRGRALGGDADLGEGGGVLVSSG
jgi:hypothetical protein